ncbi:MAG: sigma-54 dependent transcriptional regulator [Planctomycetes bacterium]|nr:sigma-54 dependent transcriptional regulator [Planctomycetota bacterium]
MSASPRILVVEDDRPHAEALEAVLEGEGYEVELADSTDAALDRLRARPFDVVLTDLVLGGRDGLELLREARLMLPELSIFLITGHASVETAVSAMREGAADYLTKPVNPAELRARLARELEKRELAADNQALRAELDTRFGLEGLVGNAPPMRRVYEVLRQVGPTDATVMLLGESGTGKELMARACHRLSPRSKRRFVAINCAALSDTLIESELFGHVKGAFTGAHSAKEGKFRYAHGGTLFLDEIGDMPLPTQAKLLRVLEEGRVTPVGADESKEVDVRIIAATNLDLMQRVLEGKFRQDLYYRLAVVAVELPALRDRLEDLPLLSDAFRRDFAEKHGKQVQAVSEEVIERFREHSWPGNVRELRNAIETMIVLDRNGTLDLADLPPSLRDPGTAGQRQAPGGAPLEPAPASTTLSSSVAHTPNATPEDRKSAPSLAGRSLREVEAELIRQTLDACKGNRQRAAEKLGMGERTLYRKIKEYDLQ